jgi:hypothetical protein
MRACVSRNCSSEDESPALESWAAAAKARGKIVIKHNKMRIIGPPSRGNRDSIVYHSQPRLPEIEFERMNRSAAVGALPFRAGTA